MTNELEGRSIVITGAGRGIGEALARGLAAAGARITVADIDEATAKTVAKRIVDDGGRAIGVAVDVVDRAQVAAMFDAASHAFGSLHGIINNAGIAQTRPFLEITAEDWRRVMDVNGLGVLIGMQEAAKQLISAGRGGRIVNMSSVAGKQGFEPLAHYSASKFSAIALTQAGAKAFGRHGINVNAICPGVVATPMWKDIGRGYREAGLGETDESAFDHFSAGILLGRPSTPGDLVGIARFLMSDAGNYVTGQAIVVDGGMVFS